MNDISPTCINPCFLPAAYPSPCRTLADCNNNWLDTGAPKTTLGPSPPCACSSLCCSCCCLSSASPLPPAPSPATPAAPASVAMVVCNAAALMLSPSVVPVQSPVAPLVPQFIAAAPAPVVPPPPPPPPPPHATTVTQSVPVPAFWTNQAYGMEAVWFGEFLRQFQRYPQRWHFIPTGYRPAGPHWEEFRDGAKVRFCCQECGHGWTSMKGRVMFWFYLDAYLNEGWIMFQLFGQKCLKCNTSRFENAMWYPEEVVKVVTNISNRVAEAYYGFPQCPHRSIRRPGRPRNPHNRDLCQACHEGVCNERR